MNKFEIAIFAVLDYVFLFIMLRILGFKIIGMEHIFLLVFCYISQKLNYIYKNLKGVK